MLGASKGKTPKIIVTHQPRAGRGIELWYGFCFMISKGRSHSIATPKFPEALDCTRRTRPDAVRNSGVGISPTPTWSATLEPCGIGNALDRRMPLTLMFSDLAQISRLATRTETSRCKG
jgi:hypothetical protein